MAPEGQHKKHLYFQEIVLAQKVTFIKILSKFLISKIPNTGLLSSHVSEYTVLNLEIECVWKSSAS